MGYSYEQYRRAMDMYRDGIGPTEISRRLSIKMCTVEDWVYRVRFHGSLSGTQNHQRN